MALSFSIFYSKIMNLSIDLAELEEPLTYADCSISFNPAHGTLRIENSRIYRQFHLIDSALCSGVWGEPGGCSLGAGVVPVRTFAFDFLSPYLPGPITLQRPRISSIGEFEVILCQSWGPYLLKYRIGLVPGFPFFSTALSVRGPAVAFVEDDIDPNLQATSMEDELISSDKIQVPPDQTLDALPHGIIHGDISRLVLFDDTDRNDSLLEKTNAPLYGRYGRQYDGNIFIIRDRQSGIKFISMKEGPTIHGTLSRSCGEFYWHDEGYCGICGSGIEPASLREDRFLDSYGALFGVSDDCESELRRYLSRTGWHPSSGPFMLANTWGDRNKDVALSDAFVQREIDVAAELGIDYQQLDDGWQQGITKNSALAPGGVWEGYYGADPQFWEVNREKFPNGLEPLARYAAERGVRLSLWFSPDSSESFTNWERDAAILLGYYRRFGIDQFKLDGIKIRDKLGEARLISLLERLDVESGGKIDYCMDVTAEIRLAYLYHRRCGSIFLENRYTDWGNYYPYRTLRNLWCLSRYLPSARFQIEVLNPQRNQDLYGEDPLAPGRYGIDYLFAIAIPGIPLFFMELQNLPVEERKKLQPLLTVYREIRDKLVQSDVIPIGEEPDGCSFSGFQFIINEQHGFILLFRDCTDSVDYHFELPHAIPPTAKLRKLYGSEGTQAQRVGDGALRLCTSHRRSTALVRY